MRTLQNILLTSICSAFLAASALWCFHQALVVPRIVQAEQGLHRQVVSDARVGNQEPIAEDVHDHRALGLEGRSLFWSYLTVLATGLAYGLMLSVALVTVGTAKTTTYYQTNRQRIQWGLLGFLILSAAPALTLPPVLTETAQFADLGVRQACWVLIAVSTALAVWMIAKRLFLQGLFLALAGQTISFMIVKTNYRLLSEDNLEFMALSLAGGLLFWLILSLSAGKVLSVLIRRQDASTLPGK